MRKKMPETCREDGCEDKTKTGNFVCEKHLEQYLSTEEEINIEFEHISDIADEKSDSSPKDIYTRIEEFTGSLEFLLLIGGDKEETHLVTSEVLAKNIGREVLILKIIDAFRDNEEVMSIIDKLLEH